MTLTTNEIVQLTKVVSALQKIVVQLNKSREAKTSGATLRKPARRTRRSGKELAAFRKMLVSERKKGVPVATLAKRHGISTAYIYQM